MTEIGNIGASSAQVADLRSAKAAKPASSDGDRFSGTENAQVSGRQPGDEPQIVGPKESTSATDPLEKAAETLQSFLPDDAKAPNTRLRIDKDDETGRFIYKNVDTESGEVINQFPPESILEFLSLYREVAGLAVDDKA